MLESFKSNFSEEKLSTILQIVWHVASNHFYNQQNLVQIAHYNHLSIQNCPTMTMQNIPLLGRHPL